MTSLKFLAALLQEASRIHWLTRQSFGPFAQMKTAPACAVFTFRYGG